MLGGLQYGTAIAPFRGYGCSLSFINYEVTLFCSELIKNKTLNFFSKTLPILKADDTLPKESLSVK